MAFPSPFPYLFVPTRNQNTETPVSVNASQGIIVVYTSLQTPLSAHFRSSCLFTASVKDIDTAPVAAAPPSPASRQHQAAAAAHAKEAAK